MQRFCKESGGISVSQREIPGHSQTPPGRQRRLLEICPALAGWLAPCAERTGPLWAQSDDTFQATLDDLCTRLKIKKLRNGLRHAFCTYHFALHANENLTAAQAGNSPAMIHAHYKGLATRAEAEKWFAIAPAKQENIIPLTASA